LILFYYKNIQLHTTDLGLLVHKLVKNIPILALWKIDFNSFTYQVPGI